MGGLTYLSTIVHDCLRLLPFLRRKFPSERGPKGPQKCTILDGCAQIAESDLKPAFESPHLDFPDKSPQQAFLREILGENRATVLRGISCLSARLVGAFFKLGCSFFAYSGAFYLQLTTLAFFTYNCSSFAYNFSFFTYNWSFFLLTVGKCV